MSDNFYEESESQELAIATFMSNVYLWMTLALVITGLGAAYVSRFPVFTKTTIFGSLILMLIEVLIVLYFRSRAMSLSFSRARILFVLFSLMNGAVFSFFFLLFRELYMETTETIATTFYITAGTFSVVSLIDHFRYEALPTLGRFLIMIIVGVIIATTVNYILQSSQIMCIINYAGVLLFCALAAYETRKIKTKFLEMGGEKNEETLKVAFLGSLALYLGTLYILIHLIDAYGDSRK